MNVVDCSLVNSSDFILVSPWLQDIICFVFFRYVTTSLTSGWSTQSSFLLCSAAQPLLSSQILGTKRVWTNPECPRNSCFVGCMYWMLKFRPCLCAALGEELGRAWLSCSWRWYRICTCQMRFVSLCFWHTVFNSSNLHIPSYLDSALLRRKQQGRVFSSNSLHPGEDWWENEKEYHESWNSLFDFTFYLFHTLAYCTRPLQEAETWLGQADGWVQRQPWISRCRCGLHHGRTVFVREARSHSSQRIDYNGHHIHHIPSYWITLNRTDTLTENMPEERTLLSS